jgi:putative Ca2+/H+ antiporter (TMEM165/GDT1 family)
MPKWAIIMSLRTRLKVNSIAIAVAVLFALIAVVFAGVALYLHVSQYFTPDIAALLTALTFVFLALLALLAAKLFSMKNKSKPARESNDSMQQVLTLLEAGMQQSIDPAISDWIVKHPGRSLTLAALAGTLLGSNADARKLIKQFVDRQLKQE